MGSEVRLPYMAVEKINTDPRDMQIREQELIKSSIRGDADARRALYGRYVQYLSAVCSRYITGRDDIKDILQESFIKIFRSLDGFEWRGDGSLKSWMTRVVVNECLKFLRDNRRLDMFVTMPELPDVPEEEDDDEGLSVEDVPPEVVHSMIRELPDGYRTVFNLFVIEGRSHREIAKMLGISEATSASQFHRTKKILSKRIREYVSGAGAQGK